MRKRVGKRIRRIGTENKLRMKELCAACAEDHPMGPDCVKKARERRMKEEKAKVSNLLFLLIKILFYTFLRRRREKRKHSARKKHQRGGRKVDS